MWTNKILLWKLCLQGFRNKAHLFEEQEDQDTIGVYYRRLQYEYNMMVELGYVDYMLIVWDVTNWAHEQQILTGAGRGSVAGSLVAWLIGLTEVDPIRFGLMFERFMNPVRSKFDPPDIDSDFQASRREEVKAYVVSKYGEQNVCAIGAHTRAFASGALKDVARVMGLDANELNSIISNRLFEVTLVDAYENLPDLKAWVNKDKYHQKCFEIAKKLEGLVRHKTIHPSGMIITRKPYLDYVPVQTVQDTVCTQWRDTMVSKRGILKLDILGLSTLDILSDTKHFLKEEVELSEIPLDDDECLQNFSDGNTTAIFQYDAPHLCGIIQRLGADSFDDLVIATTIARPGSSQTGIMDSVIKRKHGKEKIEHLHKSVEELLADTYGYPIYQELVMKMAHQAGGIPLVDTEVMRDAIKHFKHDVMATFETAFTQGAKAKGASEAQIRKMWQLIQGASGYAFNKCLAGDTMVQTQGGASMSIQELYERQLRPAILTQDLATGVNYYGKIEAIHNNGVDRVWRVTLKEGQSIVANTRHHLYAKLEGNDFWDWYGLWRLKDRYLAGYKDVVKTESSESEILVVVPYSCGYERIFDIEMVKTHHFFANGILVHNSHAVAYSLLSYWCMFFKTHHPLEYLTACLRHEGTQVGVAKVINEAKRLGIQILPVSINHSKVNFSIEGNSIRTGLSNIKNVGLKSAIEVVRNQPYKSRQDLESRVEKRACNKRVVDNLKKAGAFGDPIDIGNAKELYGFVPLYGYIENNPKLDLGLLSDCQLCELCDYRLQVVKGVGSISSEVMIVGESPGHNEEVQGVPFVGKAGKVLRNIWLPFLGLEADDCYITNVMKCAPRESQYAPISKPDENKVALCSQWLDLEIQQVKPKIIIALGSYALLALSGKLGIMKKRGRGFQVQTQFESYPEIKGFALLHPAFSLYKKDKATREAIIGDLEALRDILVDMFNGGE